MKWWRPCWCLLQCSNSSRIPEWTNSSESPHSSVSCRMKHRYCAVVFACPFYYILPLASIHTFITWAYHRSNCWLLGRITTELRTMVMMAEQQQPRSGKMECREGWFSKEFLPSNYTVYSTAPLSQRKKCLFITAQQPTAPLVPTWMVAEGYLGPFKRISFWFSQFLFLFTILHRNCWNKVNSSSLKLFLLAIEKVWL